MIPEHVYKTQIKEYKRTLVYTAEIIQQELVGIRVIASNYIEEARKAVEVLSTIII